jgi:hypothetical protein
MLTKVDKIVFDHADNFTGEVQVSRGEVSMKVPMDAMVRLVAEKVRHDRIRALENAKPSELIAKLA